MSDRVLQQIITDLVLFLAYADDDAVDPDAAVAQLELASSTIKRLGSREKQRFWEFLEGKAQAEPNPEVSERYRSMLTHLGIETPKKRPAQPKSPRKGTKR